MALLVEVSELGALPEPVLFVDARVLADYEQGHIPGAIHHDTFEFANEETDGENLDLVVDAWRQMFCSVGITLEGSVVFYDVGTENRAARPAFMLHHMGHPHSHVLHGGMTAWLESGGAVSTEQTVRPAVSWEVPVHDRRHGIVIGIDEVSSRLGRDDVVFLDVRDEPEYEGVRKMQDNPRLGRIPGAVSFEWAHFLRRRDEFPPEAGTPRGETFVLDRLRPAEDLRLELAKAGVESADTEVVIYCQKSHRASLVYVVFDALGYRNGHVYAGSFREWSRREDLPVEL